MQQKPKKPAIPFPHGTTIRRELMELLTEEPQSARDLSQRAHLPEREVYDHLEHIRKTLKEGGGELVVTPAECGACGFVFRKRTRLTRPGKCPLCRHESVREPLFAIARRE